MKKIVISILALILLFTATACSYVGGDDTSEENPNFGEFGGPVKQYNKHAVISQFKDGRLFYYSTGIFEVEPWQYDEHMATMSMILADASETYLEENDSVIDYSNGDKTIKEMYEVFHLSDFYSSEFYTKEPQADSIGYAIGRLKLWLNRKEDLITVISVTVRSSNYRMEWASNVKIGENGEAQGFKEGAEQVKQGVDEYIETHHLTEDLHSGKVMFWLQGFSRGGAVANLTAKRLIDAYQEYNADVYAYCLEAPQGGVASAEIQGKDYRGIHNVINPNDIVPYVGPSAYGFKRYGVDHYMFDWLAVSYDLQQSFAFTNNLCDNKAYAVPSDSLKKSLNYMLRDLVTDYSTLSDYEPHYLKYYVVTIAGGYKEEKTSLTLEDFLSKFVDDLAFSCSRKTYANDGLQTALRNLMIFSNSGGDISALGKEFEWWDYLFIGASNLPAIIPEIISLYVQDVIDTIVSIFVDGKQDYLLDDWFKRDVAAAVKEAFESRDDLASKLDANYPGGKTAAYTDLYNITYFALGGFKSVNEAITLIKNIEDTMKNHQPIQALGWLMAQDDWYPGSIWNPK